MLASSSLADILFTLALGLLLARWLGHYMARVFLGRPTVVDGFFDPIDRAVYRVLGVDPRRSMGWKEYAGALIIANGAALGFVFALLFLQGNLPLNAFHVPGMTWDLASLPGIGKASVQSLATEVGGMTKLKELVVVLAE